MRYLETRIHHEPAATQEGRRVQSIALQELWLPPQKAVLFATPSVVQKIHCMS